MAIQTENVSVMSFSSPAESQPEQQQQQQRNQEKLYLFWKMGEFID